MEGSERRTEGTSATESSRRARAPTSKWLALNAVGKGYKLITMTTQQDLYICDVCGAEMLEIHCKLICPRCGFTRDCSDP